MTDTLETLMTERDDIERRIAAIAVSPLTAASTMLDSIGTPENIQVLRDACNQMADPFIKNQLISGITLLENVPAQIRASLAQLQQKAATPAEP